MTSFAEGSPYRHAHEVARTLRDALSHLGVPENELQQLTSRPDAIGDPGVYIPRMSVRSTERLLRALGPALGPEFVGRTGMVPAVQVGDGR